MLFAAKYGKEFVTASTELMPDCGVNRQVIFLEKCFLSCNHFSVVFPYVLQIHIALQIIELLSIRAPPVEEKLRLLKEIAEEHELDWDPTASETELLKPNEDLLVREKLFDDEWPYGLVTAVFSPLSNIGFLLSYRMVQASSLMGQNCHFPMRNMTNPFILVP